MIIVTIAGQIGKTPEVKTMPSGKNLTSFSFATNIGFGEKRQTVWWNIAIWGDKFEKIMPFLVKGKSLMITGSLTRSPQVYTGKDGVAKVSSLDLEASIIEFVGGEKKDGNSTETNGNSFRQDQDNECPF